MNTVESANPAGALDAVILAAGTCIAQKRTVAPVGASPRIVEQQVLAAVDRAAVALLGRLLMLRLSTGTPIYQLASCSVDDDVSDLATGLAQASAVLVGRTLFVRIEAPLLGRLHPALPTNGPILDAFLPRLHHFRIDAGVAAGMLPDGPARQDRLVTLASQFRLIVVASTDCATSMALAPLCTGTVLVVRAGRTQLASVRATAAGIVASGGRILGTVLGMAPPASAR